MFKGLLSLEYDWPGGNSSVQTAVIFKFFGRGVTIFRLVITLNLFS